MESSLVGSSVASYWGAVIGVSILKLLLINSYRSTDFEVHRNWLAITHSLPLEKWYYENTSEWTMDYPPFFAYFEWTLSQAAQYFDKDMLTVTNLNYASFHTILFQKLSAILADFLLAYAVLRCSIASSVLLRNSSSKSKKSKTHYVPLETLFILVFLNAGLFIVDHIHFQYNGFLFGILLLSIATCLEGKYYQTAFIFASLINFKHIFLYVAPAFGIYLLRKTCFPPSSPLNLLNLVKSVVCFGLIGLSVLGASFGPFLNHIPQILTRLFPFQRGLSHAYWAPNFWAAYNTLDWLLNIVQKRGKSAVTGGLVGEAALSVLPQVAPIHTLVLTVAFMLPTLYALWRDPTKRNFIRGVVLTGWTSFMFGYHVHEKAILNVLIPLSLLALHHHPNTYFIALVSGTVSLFPLLFTPTEIILKALITVFHLSLTLQVIPVKCSLLEKLYLLGFLPVYLVENIGPIVLPNLPFLPLMIVSDYCFVGVFYSYAKFYYEFLQDSSTDTPKKPSPVKNFDGEEKARPTVIDDMTSPISTRSLRKRNK